MSIARAIIAVPLLLLFLWGSVLNAVIVWRALRRPSERRSSMVPFVCGVAGVIGLRMLPYEPVRPYAWIALLLDPGCAFFIIFVCLPALAREFWATNVFVRIARYVHRDPETTVELNLYRRGHCTLEMRRALTDTIATPAPGSPATITGAYQTGMWEMVADRLVIRIGDWQVIYRAISTIQERGAMLHTLVWSPDSTATPFFDRFDLTLVKGKPPRSQ